MGAKEVSEWNNRQPAGFWKGPVTSQPAVSSIGFLDETLFEVAGIRVTGTAILALLCAIALPLFLSRSSADNDKIEDTQLEGKSCEAKHILMAQEEDLVEVKTRLDAGEDFAKLAEECSTCPSAKIGGSLGRRIEGSMSEEMNAVCFDPATQLGEVLGPIKTKFGYHLIVVESRSEANTTSESATETRGETE